MSDTNNHGRGNIKDFWDERYEEGNYIYGTEPNEFLKETISKLELPSGGTCLMLADGDGRNGVFMAKKGFKVVSVDISQAGLDKAQQLAKKESVTLQTVLADLGEFDFGTEQWDCIIGISSHLPPQIRARVLQVIPPSLCPGGYCIFEGYTPKQLEFKTGGPPAAEFMFSKEIFAEAFDSALQVERNEELIRKVVEGKYHFGDGAVVQFVGSKAKS